MLFGINLELHLNGYWYTWFFKVFAKLILVWGGVRVIYGLPLPLISLHCSFCFFTCADFICYWILINWFDLIWSPLTVLTVFQEWEERQAVTDISVAVRQVRAARTPAPLRPATCTTPPPSRGASPPSVRPEAAAAASPVCDSRPSSTARRRRCRLCRLSNSTSSSICFPTHHLPAPPWRRPDRAYLRPHLPQL